MEFKVLLTVCITVFLAELGDKTQFAVMAFSAKADASPWVIFAGASMGLVAAAGMGVLVGQWLSAWLNPKWLTLIAGVAFIAIGIWTLVGAVRMNG